MSKRRNNKTIRVDDATHDRAARMARQANQPITSVIQEAVRNEETRRKAERKRLREWQEVFP